MSNYLVTDQELTAVADAIRAKGGTSDPLIFPTGFVDAIGDIQTGGGGGGVVTRPVTIENSYYDHLYYTDEAMTPIAIFDINTDLTAELLPVGSILVLAIEGVAPPMPAPMTVSGLELIGRIFIRSYCEVAIYKVIDL